jgi:hypothetical protein
MKKVLTTLAVACFLSLHIVEVKAQAPDPTPNAECGVIIACQTSEPDPQCGVIIACRSANEPTSSDTKSTGEADSLTSYMFIYLATAANLLGF